jgi:hypothetical protein
MGSDSSLTIEGCDAGFSVLDYYAQRQTSVAQMISNVINRGVYAYDVGLYFSHSNAFHDTSLAGAAAPNPSGTLPIFLVPEGTPGNKPVLKSFCPNGQCSTN